MSHIFRHSTWSKLTTLFVMLLVWSTSPALAQEKVLRIGYNGLPTEKGNAFSNVQTPTILLIGGVFDGLTRLTKDGEVQPWLATSWEAVDDLTWRFKLRTDVTFSNGKPFDAAAVAHTVNYLTGPGPQTEGQRRDMRFLNGAAVIDSHTVDIRTTIPVPMFPRYAAVLLIVEPDAWQSMGIEQFSLTPVGTGPLVVESWEPTRAVARANPTSWRPLQIDGVEFIVLPDVGSRITALVTGGLDAAYAAAPEDFDLIERAGGSIASVRDGAASAVMLQFSERENTPLKDIRVRHALNYAVDKQTIVDVLLGGRTVVSGQPGVREAFGFDPSIPHYPYDPDRTKTLLAEAGYEDGFAMTFVAPAGGGTNGDLVAQRVADDLGRVGVRVEIQARPVMRFLVDFVRGRIESDAFRLQWGSYPIVDVIQTTNINSCRKTQPWYCDPAIQPTIDAAWTEMDPNKAEALRHQIMRHYHDQAPSIFLYENIAFVGLSPRTKGFDQTFGFVHFEDIQLD